MFHLGARNSNRPAVLPRLGVLAAAAGLFLANLGGHGVVSEEFRWAEIAREMRASGDWFHPTLNGETYFDKPVGSYWLIVAASRLTGGVTEGTARLPAALAGLLGVWLLMALAGRWYGANAGLLAGAILATSFGFDFYARRATADIETVTGVLATVWLFDRRVNGWPTLAESRDVEPRTRRSPRESGRRAEEVPLSAGAAPPLNPLPSPWLLLPWLVMGVTSQMKGLLGFALPLAVFGAFGTWNGLAERRPGDGRLRAVLRGNRWFLNGWTAVGLPLGVAVFLLPYVLAASGGGLTDGLALLYRENVQRFIHPHNHTGPVYLYVGVLLVLALPWSLFLPAALLNGRAARPADRLAWAYFLAVFAFFTVSASRRSYYLLPVLPPTAVLIAVVWVTPAARLRPLARRLRAGGYAVLAVAVPLVVAVLALPPGWRAAPFDTLPPTPAVPLVLVGGSMCLLAIGWGCVRARVRPLAVAAVAAAGIGYATVIAGPAADEYRTRRAFADAVRDATGFHDLALYRARDLVFDLHPPAPLPDYQTPAEVTAAMDAARDRWLVSRRRYWTALQVAGTVVAEEPVRPWDGPDQFGDKMLLIDTRVPKEFPK